MVDPDLHPDPPAAEWIRAQSGGPVLALGGSQMSPLERLDQLRKRTLLVGAGLSVPVSGIGALTTDMSLWTAAWMLGFASVMVLLALRRSATQRWALIVPVMIGVALGPWACATNGVTMVQLTTTALIPLVVGVLFIDEFDVVVPVTLTGVVSTTAFFANHGFSTSDLVMTAVIMSGVSIVLGFAAYTTRKLRELDRATEFEHSQALRLSESRRAQAERLAIVGRLASGVAHEINNPLAFVKANVGSLRRSFLLGEEEFQPAELKEILDDTAQGIDRICQIVADLKGFAREDGGILEAVDVREVVTGAVRLATVRLPRDMKVTIDIPSMAPMVRANPRKLGQVMLNLLVNAGEALEEVRTLKPEVTIRAVTDGGLLRLTVTDNGPGIPPQVMGRMFEPFFTTKPPGKGTGLGLALSREYIESFNGTLAVNNVEPRGAQFAMALRITANTGETPLPVSTVTPEPLAEKPAALLRRRRSGT